ncbi:hypothetical protein ACFWBN_39650 [Streptomyces sp. NPDC059989]|uniref:hypothetical protein n=1 Tax=Streptomyces sp. NPDC059989 TaxID=3347026 RepID=UPI00368E74C5
MTITDAKPFALIVQNDGGFILADWTCATEPHELLLREGVHAMGRLMHPHRVDSNLTVWADGEALWKGGPANPSAARLLDTAHVFCGPVLLTGAIAYSTARNAEGLTQDEALQLIERHLTGKRALLRSLHIPAQRTR